MQQLIQTFNWPWHISCKLFIYIPRVVCGSHDLVAWNRMRCKFQLVREYANNSRSCSRESRDVAELNVISLASQLKLSERLQSWQLEYLTLNSINLTLISVRYNNWHFSNQPTSKSRSLCLPSLSSMCSQANLLETSTECLTDWLTVTRLYVALRTIKLEELMLSSTCPSSCESFNGAISKLFTTCASCFWPGIGICTGTGTGRGTGAPTVTGANAVHRRWRCQWDNDKSRQRCTVSGAKW